MIAPHSHEVQEKPISIRRGESGGAVRGGPLWSPASATLARWLLHFMPMGPIDRAHRSASTGYPMRDTL